MATQSKSNSQPSRPLDILEVYCEEDSQITQQVRRHGGRAIRFTRSDGDLNTEEGIQKLWLWIYMYEPRHVWLAPSAGCMGNLQIWICLRGWRLLKRLPKNAVTIVVNCGYAMKSTGIKFPTKDMHTWNNLQNHVWPNKWRCKNWCQAHTRHVSICVGWASLDSPIKNDS